MTKKATALYYIGAVQQIGKFLYQIYLQGAVL